MVWSLYEEDKFLKPLCFSNGKDQEQVVKETLQAISEGNKIIFIKGVCGTGKCLDKDTLVFCKPNQERTFSYHKISTLINKEGIILSLDKEGNIVRSNFKNVRTTGKKELYKLKTRTGRELLASKNHPFLTITEKGLEWLPLEKLNQKSYICLSNNIKLEENEEINDNEIKILAHLIAEGKLGDKAGSPKYYQSPRENLETRKDYITALKNLFPEGEIKEKDDEVRIKFGLMNTTHGTTNKLRLLIRKYGLDEKKSKEKFIPKEIFGLKKEKISLFLSRLFSCDGTIYKRKNGQIIIDYTSISKRMIYEISLLLNFFGIQHTITSKKFRDIKEYAFRITIADNKSLKRYIEEIGFVGRKQTMTKSLISEIKDSKFTNIDKIPRITREYIKSLGYSYLEMDRFLNYKEILNQRKHNSFKEIRNTKLVNCPCVFKQGKIDFLRSHLQKINEHICDKQLSIISNKDIFWDKIKSITFLKEDETYDLEVEENNNFIANGIIVHNSAIALHLAKEIGKTSVIVPGKNLQNQYKRDYEGKKFLKKKDGKKLKINVITGRRNHKCKFLADNEKAIPRIKKEINLKLHDIFEDKREKVNDLINGDLSAENNFIPCKIEIKEKNWNRIREYLKENNKVNIKDFEKITDVKRLSIAPVCPYWSPVLPEKYDMKISGTEEKKVYDGVGNSKCVFHKRKPGCSFYEQFNSYIDSDVVVFNSMKYKLETLLGRKPQTELEVIDECDEFLDSFSNQSTINFDKLQNALIYYVPEGEDQKKVEEALAFINSIKRDIRIENMIKSRGILPLRETAVFDLLKLFLKEGWIKNADDESYLYDVYETALAFASFMNESYITVSKKDNTLFVNVVTTNLAKKFEELVNKNKLFVLMSGTIHSEEVLKEIFGLKNFKIIDAEIQSQGKIDVIKTGLEEDCKYANFDNGKISRGEYLESLDKCLKIAKKPVLVHVNAFKDLPSEDEIDRYNLQNLISNEKVREMQSEDREGELIKNFKEGEIDILFSTRDSRGVDFPGEECNSIVFTKYPNPNVEDAFWKILMKTRPQHYWSFYRDKAQRELLQKLYRGLRFKDDHVYVLSPDSRVLNFFEKIF